jgi:acetyl esterase/lipase
MQYAQAMLGKAKSASVSAEVSPEPEVENVPYGPHERNVLDLWKAAGEGPRPLVVLIHGGGFTSGDKSKWRSSPLLRQLLESGISCAAINYRFRQEAPIQEILRDASRAVQYLRSRAQDWSLDPAHFAGLGGSAGAGTSLWLVTRDDLADPRFG